MKHTLYILVVLLICSCLQETDQMVECEIALRPTISDIEVATRADAYVGGVPTSNRPLNVDLWFSLTAGDYSVSTPTDTRTYIPCHTTTTFSSDQLIPIFYNGDNSQTLTYPTSGNPVYCVGLYPQNIWNFNGVRTFSADLTGRQDLMFAPEISGMWNEQFGTNGNDLKFRHLLTWFKFVICATSYDAIEAWGDVQSISMTTANSVTVNSADAVTASYTGEQQLEILDAPVELSILKNDVGDIFCAPCDKIMITVKTSDGRTAKKEMKPVTGAFLAGNQYIMVLYFDPLSIIDGVCTLASWENQNDNLYLN